MKKRILSMLIVLAMILSVMPLAYATSNLSGTCGDNLTWSYDENTHTLTISGSGMMKNYGYGYIVPWEDLAGEVTTVAIRDGVSSIGDCAFQNFTALTSVSIPDSVTWIGGYAFSGCSSLKEITLPNNEYTYLGWYMFSDCTSLTSFVFPEKMTSLASNMFSGCTGLSSVTLPEGMTEIEYAAFYGCSSLTSITIPAQVEKISNDAFYGCSNLAEFKLADGNTYFQVVDGVLYNPEGTEIVLCPVGRGGDFDIPDGITTIGEGAFYNCESLTGITIPDSVTTIEGGAFCNTHIKKFVIPGSVTSIGATTFRFCSSTIAIVFEGSAPQMEGGWTACSATGYYPEGDESWGEEIITDEFGAEGFTWESYTPGEEVPPVSGQCGENVTWHYDEASCTLTISGEGKMENYDVNSNPQKLAPWVDYGVQTVIIEDGVTSIGDYAFDSCNEMSSISIANTVTSIGRDAFRSCNSLTEISLPENLSRIEAGAFQRNPFIKTVIFPKNTEYIGSYAFAGCYSLSTIYFTGDAPEIADIGTTLDTAAFYECSEITAYYPAGNETWTKDVMLVYEYGGTITWVAHEHNYTAAVTEPTCTEKGYTTYTCGVCSYSWVGDYVNSTGHTFGAWTQVKVPTVESTGLEERVCACGEKETRPVDKLVHVPEFTDVVAGAYYEDAVAWAVENGITTGTTDTTFSPNVNCNRAQVVTFLWRAAGEPEPASSENPFTDVAPGTFYYDAVLWAVEKGITTGTSKTTFGPNDNCTRGQVATFLWRAQGEPEAASAENPFNDISSSAFYYEAVLWAVEAGVTTGTSKTTFGPNETCIRGQIVTFLYRAMA